MTELERYRNALMWVFDRLSIGAPGMTAAEQHRTFIEIGKVLRGIASPAADYRPAEWDESAKLSARQKTGAA